MLTLILMCCACIAFAEADDGGKNENTHRCVISFKDEQSLERFRAMPPENLEIGGLSPGFPKHRTIVDAEILSSSTLCSVVEAIRKAPGVEAVSPKRKHRFSLVVEFDSAVASAEAAKRLNKVGVMPLKLSVSGNRKQSPYFEVIVETDDSLKDLLSSIRKADDVVVAELSVEFRQDRAR